MIKRIIFMGTPDYATEILKELISSSYEVVALFTQADKPVGRKQILTSPHIKKYCLDNFIDIPIYQPSKLKANKEIQKQIEELNPDFIVVAAYGQILPKEILNIAPCINLHASLLPKYRGASPIQEALLNADKYTGVTSMLMEEGLDSGEILGLEYLKITPNMDVLKVFESLSKIAAKLTITTLDNFDKIEPKKQNELETSFCKKIKKEDGLVDFSNAEKLYLKYKAYCFWPGIFIENGLKLKDISLVEKESDNKEGQILKINENSIILTCKKGSIEIRTLQAPSKKTINAVDYLKGKRLVLGDILQ